MVQLPSLALNVGASTQWWIKTVCGLLHATVVTSSSGVLLLAYCPHGSAGYPSIRASYWRGPSYSVCWWKKSPMDATHLKIPSEISSHFQKPMHHPKKSSAPSICERQSSCMRQRVFSSWNGVGLLSSQKSSIVCAGEKSPIFYLDKEIPFSLTFHRDLPPFWKNKNLISSYLQPWSINFL